MLRSYTPRTWTCPWGSRVLGMTERQVGEERVDRRETVVAGNGRVVASSLQVIEEGRDERGVELADVERARRGAGSN